MVMELRVQRGFGRVEDSGFHSHLIRVWFGSPQRGWQIRLEEVRGGLVLSKSLRVL
jgi:hypothetical protein